MYIVIQKFTDLETGHKYGAGDTYPAEGLETSAERVKALKDGNNKAGRKLIKEVKASKPKKVEAPKEDAPVEEKPKEEKPKTKKAKKGGTKKASK